jgi:hypothetical protein
VGIIYQKEGFDVKKVKFPIFIILISALLSFNAFAMNKNTTYITDAPAQSPLNEKKYEDRSLGSRWTWIEDDLCVSYRAADGYTKERLKRQFDLGAVSRWATNESGKWEVKTRDTYSGKWSQSSEGIWSFEFDDKTIPVGVTKIDGVLYAFTGYGELKADYEYYDGLKTEADGLVKADGVEFAQWLTTQYLPECTSHE